MTRRSPILLIPVLLLSMAATCRVRTPKPAPPTVRTITVVPHEGTADGPRLSDVAITLTWGSAADVGAKSEPHVVQQADLDGIPNCPPTTFTATATKVGYTDQPAARYVEAPALRPVGAGPYGSETVMCVGAGEPNVVLHFVLTKNAPPAPPKPVWPPTLARSALPSHNPDTFESPDENTPKSWHRVFTTLPQEPPAQPDVRWWRGNAWGVTVPGLPAVPGGARPGSPAESRVLTYFLGRYERAKPGMEKTILDAHHAAGYTHFSLSPQDEFAQGMSEDQYVEMAARVKAAGFFVHHLFLSKYYTDKDNPDLSQSFRLIDKLVAAGALDKDDTITPAWEGNFMSPEVLERVILAFGAKLDSLPSRPQLMLHFYPHYIAWQRDGHAPAEFWAMCIRAGVDGVLYQGDPAWTMGMLSARLQDALHRLVAGGTWGLSKSMRVVIWEDQATNQYNNGMTGNGRVADEDEGDLRGLEAISTPGPIPVNGSGNGCRLMSGGAC